MSPNLSWLWQAPMWGSVGIDRELIGRLIGPKGSSIQALEATTGARLAVFDDAGSVQVRLRTLRHRCCRGLGGHHDIRQLTCQSPAVEVFGSCHTCMKRVNLLADLRAHCGTVPGGRAGGVGGERRQPCGACPSYLLLRSCPLFCRLQLGCSQSDPFCLLRTGAVAAAPFTSLTDAVVRHMQPGTRYAAKVVKMMDYGAFVELTGGTQGLLHISEIAVEKVGCPPNRCRCPLQIRLRMKSV